MALVVLIIPDYLPSRRQSFLSHDDDIVVLLIWGFFNFLCRYVVTKSDANKEILKD